MNLCQRFFYSLLIAALLLVAAPMHAETDPLLFIGNSYTMATGDPQASNLGVGKMVEAIAKAKGHDCMAQTLATGGKDFAFHFAQPKTAEILATQKWKAVILQNHSVSTLSDTKLEEHLHNAEALARMIQEKSPGSAIVFFQTWARAEGHSMYQSGNLTPAGMTEKSRSGYAATRDRIIKIFPDCPVRIAPVGTAFALALKNNPEINLYSSDLHHASAHGSYLAALVIYATLYQDNPVGAVNEFTGLTIDATVAAQLQQSAREATTPSP